KLVEREVAVMQDGNVGEFMVNGPGNFNFDFGSKVISSEDDDAALVYKDSEQVLEVRDDNGKKHLLAKSTDGKTLFDGPIDTDEQRKGIPANVAEKLKKLEDQAAKYDSDKHGKVKIRVIEP